MEVIRKPYPIHGTPDDEVCVIAVGDIHGKFGLLQRLLSVAEKTIPKDAKRVELVLLGDIIDRGDAAIEIIDLIKAGIKDWKVIPILGNHEQLLLRVLAASDETYSMRWSLWRGNGGLQTLENLQINIPRLVDTTVEKHRSALIEALGKDRIDYLNQFVSHHRNGDLLFVHAGIDPKISLEENFSKAKLDDDPRHWAWIRDDFLDHGGLYPEETFVVHGHTVIPGPKLEPHRIGLDTGACVYGVLSAATFYNHQMTIFQVTHD